jgi:CHAT domain-containing protein/tetratricopeptide (TPR) repeat protein
MRSYSHCSLVSRVPVLSFAFGCAFGGGTIVTYLSRAAGQDEAAVAPIDKPHIEKNELWQQAQRLRREGKLTNAAEAGEKLLTIERQRLGEAAPGVLSLLQWLASVYEENGNWAAAEARRRDCVAWLEKQLGANHWETIHARVVLNNIAGLKFLTAAQRTQLDVAFTASDQAHDLAGAGKLAEAIPRAKQAVDIYGGILGKGHADYATSLYNLGELYRIAYEYDLAARHYEEALEIRRALFGEMHPACGQVLNGMGQLATVTFQFEQAERLLRRGLEIAKNAFGERSANYASALQNLADLFRESQYFAKAEPLYRNALEIRFEVLGTRSSDYVVTLNNLADCLYGVGRLDEAETLLMQALELWPHVEGGLTGDMAATLNNLAMIYAGRGDRRAIDFLSQGLEVTRNIRGKDHPAYAAALENFADIGIRLDYFFEVESLYQQANAIREKQFGLDHPEYAKGLTRLGALYALSGRWGEAETLYLQAIAIRRSRLGASHPLTAETLCALGLLYGQMGAKDQSAALLLESLEAIRQWEESVSIILNEQEQIALSRQYQLYVDHYLSCQLDGSRNGDAAFGAVLNWKGATLVRQRAARVVQGSQDLAPLFSDLRHVVQNWTALVRASAVGGDAALSERIDALAMERRRLEEELFRQSAVFRDASADVAPDDIRAVIPPGTVLVSYSIFDRSVSTDLEPRGALGARLNVENGNLVVTELIEGGAAALDGRLQVDDVVLALAEGDKPFVSIEGMTLEDAGKLIPGAVGTILRIKVRRLDAQGVAQELEFSVVRTAPRLQRKMEWSSVSSLVAFVVRPGHEIVMVDLGEMEPIERQIDRWRSSYGASSEALEAGQVLRERLWAPLESALGDAATVLVSTDGALGRLPMAALPGREPGTYLIEDYRLALVPVPRLIPELLAQGRGDEGLERELLLVGGIDYDRREAAEGLPASRDEGLMAIAVSRGAVRQTAQGLRWRSLPGADGEASAIEDLFSSQNGAVEYDVARLAGAAATEEQFRALAPTSRILHLATHGFFAPEERRSALEADEPEEGAPLSGGFQVSEKPGYVGFPPGLLSGLVLAGANDPPELPDDPAAFASLPEDGILSAEELAFLPLGDVELAVLSACETGLGEVAGGEGLLGIQRAFQISGVRTTVASLWKVDDAMTQRLMTALYRNVLEHQQSYLDALRNAQLEMLRELRDPKRRDALIADAFRGADDPVDAAALERGAPYLWAAFTLSGDWR